MDLTLGEERIPNRIGELRKNGWFRVISNRMNRIQTQPIKMIFREPIERVMNKKISDRTTADAVEIYAITPRCVVPVGEELRGVGIKVISFGTEVVVNHIEQDHHPAAVGALNEQL